MGELPWWTVQGRNELPASGILLYEKEINLPPVCSTGKKKVNWIAASSIVDACLILCLV